MSVETGNHESGLPLEAHVGWNNIVYAAAVFGAIGSALSFAFGWLAWDEIFKVVGKISPFK